MILSWLRCYLEWIIIIFSFHTFKCTFACVIWTYSVCAIFHSFVVLSTSSSSEESKGKSALWKDLDILYTICYISISLSIFSSILQSSSTLPWMGTISFLVWIWLAVDNFCCGSSDYCSFSFFKADTILYYIFAETVKKEINNTELTSQWGASSKIE